jgi:hypothetical protein
MNIHNPSANYRLHPKNKKEADVSAAAQLEAVELEHREVEVIPCTLADGISADAKYIASCASQDALVGSDRIITQLWIIFVAMPIAIGIIIALAE